MPDWLSRDVLLISLSAFFADAGYQALVVGLPLFLVIYLKAPVYLFGIVMALAYGGGSLFAYLGGKASEKYGKKRIALIGNLLIPILSLTGLASTAAEAGALYSGGWWARNFRTPARRAMLGDITKKEYKGRVYGFLNALDIGGGLVAVTYLSFAILAGMRISTVFIYTAVPILMSSLCLALVKYKGVGRIRHAVASIRQGIGKAAARAKTYKAVIAATGIYGLSFYSISFPILTVAQRSGSLAGVASYAIFLISSAVFGYIVGVRVRKLVHGLAFLGYFLAGVGSLVIGLAYAFSLGIVVSYVGMLLIGMAAGAIETFEPTIISIVKQRRGSGSGMGALTASRSIGLFAANLIVGFLYAIGPIYSYSITGMLAFAAGAVLILFGREL
ncbi:MAG: MFS transporter [Candidatus Marsarchaeota archaeon]|nr:MFS transporter [Candidatus Marsarchaeota archaeon]